jgi:hypothetical protein
MDSEIDMLVVIGLLGKIKDTYLNLLLRTIKDLYDTEGTPEYLEIRKAILDHFNDYHRAFVNVVTDGDI